MLVKICFKCILSAIFPVHAGLRQTNRIRALYLQRALQQEVGFFDVHATTGMMMQGLNEDTLIIQQAIGEKVGVTIHFLATFIVGYAIGKAAAICACAFLEIVLTRDALRCFTCSLCLQASFQLQLLSSDMLS